MTFKYHTEVPNVKEAIVYYSNLFEGKIVKDGSDGHGNVKLFNQISLMVYKQNNERVKIGSHIFRFDDSELKLFDKTLKRIKKESSIEIKYDLQSWSWETTELIAFKDKYGYTWILERNTQPSK